MLAVKFIFLLQAPNIVLPNTQLVVNIFQYMIFTTSLSMLQYLKIEKKGNKEIYVLLRALLSFFKVVRLSMAFNFIQNCVEFFSFSDFSCSILRLFIDTISLDILFQSDAAICIILKYSSKLLGRLFNFSNIILLTKLNFCLTYSNYF